MFRIAFGFAPRALGSFCCWYSVGNCRDFFKERDLNSNRSFLVFCLWMLNSKLNNKKILYFTRYSTNLEELLKILYFSVFFYERNFYLNVDTFNEKEYRLSHETTKLNEPFSTTYLWSDYFSFTYSHKNIIKYKAVLSPFQNIL